MPEELLRNRNKHEKKIYSGGRKNHNSTGKLEDFREFISGLLKEQGDRFRYFHNVVTENSSKTVKLALETCKDKEIKEWLELYLVKGQKQERYPLLSASNF
jgi:hypothetical protein